MKEPLRTAGYLGACMAAVGAVGLAIGGLLTLVLLALAT